MDNLIIGNLGVAYLRQDNMEMLGSWMDSYPFSLVFLINQIEGLTPRLSRPNQSYFFPNLTSLCEASMSWFGPSLLLALVIRKQTLNLFLDIIKAGTPGRYHRNPIDSLTPTDSLDA